jgi:hypothetical protein
MERLPSRSQAAKQAVAAGSSEASEIGAMPTTELTWEGSENRMRHAVSSMRRDSVIAVMGGSCMARLA